jgi:hypothetical protein
MSNQRKPNVELKCRPSSATYSPVMNRLSTSKLRPALAAGAGAGDVGDADEAVEIGDRVRFTGAGLEHVEHLGARAEELGTARDRPRIPGPPRRERRARPGHLGPEDPDCSQACPGEKPAAARPMPVARLERANGHG